jgi:hypothetical protein
MGFVGTAGRKTRDTDDRSAGGAQGSKNTSPFSSLAHDRLADRNHDRSIFCGPLSIHLLLVAIRLFGKTGDGSV